MFSKIPVPARLLALGVLAAVPFLTSCEPAVATFTVTTNVDAVDANIGDGVCATAAGQCSLRAAVQEGNAVTEPGPVDVVLEAAIYDLTRTGAGEDLGAVGDLDLTRRFRFIGTREPGIATSIIGFENDRVFDAHPGSELHMTDIDTGESTADVGGVIRATNADVTLVRSRVAEGDADVAGLVASLGGTLSLTDSALHAGEADQAGALLAGQLVMVRSSISGSVADSGGIVTLTSGDLQSSIDTSTIASNWAVTGQVVASSPGGLVIRDSAFAENLSSTGSLSGGAGVQVANSVLDAASGPDCGAAVTSLGSNLASSTSCGLTTPTDQQGVPLSQPSFLPAGLGYAPHYDHPLVVDAGTGCAAVDQSGAARPADGDTDGVAECDRGPVESQLKPLDLTVSSPVDAPDLVPGDGRCTTSVGQCTLRAAVQETNARPTADKIALGPTTYVLSRAGAGEDAAATGDLDILDDLTVRVPTSGQATIDANDIDRIFDVHSGTVVLELLTITDGTEAAGGGGIRAAAGTDVAVRRSTLSANVAVGGGGGILAAGEVEIDRSTLHHNGGSSGSGGGVLVTNGGVVDVVNSTFHANNATRGSAISVNRGGAAVVRASTIASNTAGVGISVGGAVSLEWTVVSGNAGGNCSDPITSLGFNLDSGATCGLNAAGDLNSTDPLLGALASNGGPTQTMKPAAGSPTTAAGVSCFFPSDQRGQARNAGGGCDRGAVEL